jgi:hypothetical protein
MSAEEKTPVVVGPAEVRERPAEPPVVARLVVEIRSDGTRTIARGALEDTTTGERTVLEAQGDSPLALMISLSRALVRLPALARRAARKVLGAAKPRADSR